MLKADSLLAGKTVFITGAGHRIGKAFALGMAGSGANIFVHYGSSRVDAEDLASEIQSLGVSGWAVGQDLGELESVDDAFRKAWSIHPIDILINNAAIFEDRDLFQTDLPSWQLHLDINLTAPFILSKAFAELYQGGSGRIINILDWRALQPGKDHFAYTVAKAGLAAMTKCLALNLAPSITVNGIALGAILPPRDSGDTAKIIEKVPLQRWADLQEVVDTAVFLISGSQYITGEIIHLDGGRHLI